MYNIVENISDTIIKLNNHINNYKNKVQLLENKLKLVENTLHKLNKSNKISNTEENIPDWELPIQAY